MLTELPVLTSFVCTVLSMISHHSHFRHNEAFHCGCNPQQTGLLQLSAGQSTAVNSHSATASPECCHLNGSIFGLSPRDHVSLVLVELYWLPVSAASSSDLPLMCAKQSPSYIRSVLISHYRLCSTETTNCAVPGMRTSLGSEYFEWLEPLFCTLCRSPWEQMTLRWLSNTI